MKYRNRAYLVAAADATERVRLERFAREHGARIDDWCEAGLAGLPDSNAGLLRRLAGEPPPALLLVEDAMGLARPADAGQQGTLDLIRARNVLIVAVNVPATWRHLDGYGAGGHAGDAVNDALLDMLTLVAREHGQRRERQAAQMAVPDVAAAPAKPSVAVTLRLWIENGSRFTRGRKRVLEEIGRMIVWTYRGETLSDHEYRLVIEYVDDAALKEQVEGLFDGIHDAAELRNCVVHDCVITEDATGRAWCDYDSGWRD